MFDATFWMRQYKNKSKRSVWKAEMAQVPSVGLQVQVRVQVQVPRVKYQYKYSGFVLEYKLSMYQVLHLCWKVS